MDNSITNRGTCPVCGFIFSNMILHITKCSDDGHKEYLDKLTTIVDSYIKTDLYTQEIADLIFEEGLFINTHFVARRIKEIEPDRKRRILSIRRMGENNPVFKQGVIDKIKNSVKDKWVKGEYSDRINGMLGKTGELNPNYKPECHTLMNESEKKYVEFLSNFEDVDVCSRCGSTENINIHHIDENRLNFLPSNLEPLCIPCHQDFHITTKKSSFATIGKKMSFAAAHRLPHHEGKCAQWHGHEWDIEVRVRKRIDPSTHMVMDFKDLKTKINTYIREELDHSTLNDIILIPTAEKLLVWCWEQLMFKAKLKGIQEIRIWESPDSIAILDIDGMKSMLNEEKIKEYLETQGK